MKVVHVEAYEEFVYLLVGPEAVHLECHKIGAVGQFLVRPARGDKTLKLGGSMRKPTLTFKYSAFGKNSDALIFPKCCYITVLF